MFWWRVRIGTSGRKPCWSTTLSSALLPFPLYTAIVLVRKIQVFTTTDELEWARRVCVLCASLSSTPLPFQKTAVVLSSELQGGACTLSSVWSRSVLELLSGASCISSNQVSEGHTLTVLRRRARI